MSRTHSKVVRTRHTIVKDQKLIIETKGTQTMSKQDKFLVTVDSESREVVRVEQMGEAGELTEVSSSTFADSGSTVAAASADATPNYAINIYMGSGETPKITTATQAAGASDEPPMIVPSPGIVPSAGSLSSSASAAEEVQS